MLMSGKFPHGLAETQESRAAAHAAGKEVSHGYRVAGVKIGTLGNIADPGFAAALARFGESDDAGEFSFSQNGFQEGRFAGTVGTDKGHHFAAVNVKVYIF